MKRTLTKLLATGCALALVYGCAQKKKPEADPFFEKWMELAEKSKGSSPPPKPRDLSIPAQSAAELLRQEPEKPVKRLPAMKVSLRMYDTDIGIVLQTLARAADKNLVLNSEVKGRINLNIKDMPWDQVFTSLLKTNGLDYEWEGDLIRVLSPKEVESRIDMLKKQRELKLSQQDVVRTELLTKVVKVNYASPEDLRKTLSNLFTKQVEEKSSVQAEGGASQRETRQMHGKVEVDPYSNSLVIQASADDMFKMIKLIDELDQPRAQVHLEAKIVEASKDVARDLGIQWGGLYQGPAWDGSGNSPFVIPGGTGGHLDTTTNKWVYDSPLGSGIGGQGFGVNLPADLAAANGQGSQLGLMFGKLGGNILEVQLSALERDNKINVLSRPSITTMDNVKAVTENGERVPFVATNPEGKLEVKFEDAVLRLEITPSVIDAETMRMNILVQKDEVDNTRNVQGNPYIIKKKTETRLICQNHETIVISGLSRNRTTKGDSGVPYLKDVPGLGEAFSRDTKTNTAEEVLIFITPHILQQAAAQGQPSPAAEGPQP